MEWISVKDRLPSGNIETAEDVLITDGENISIGWHQHDFEEIDPVTGNYFPEEILWHQLGGLKTDHCGWPEVTHWMPLPEPPKRERSTSSYAGPTEF